ncbi:HEAT repeat domain-containing protein [Leptospira kmetyi]|uniref:HEAT repeat domain-containing protein n=1 Tax=Leptospira kmetyi TaxID=408139 RepID=UPI003EBC7B66
MKFRSLLILALVVSFSSGALLAEKSTEEHIKTLSSGSGSDSEKYESAVALGKNKEKSAIPELINLLNRNNEPKIATAAAIALGRIAEPGDATIALKNKIISSENGDIVYASLASLLNITTKSEKLEDSTKEAFEYADKNRRSDEFVSDFLDLIKKKLKL